MKTKQKKMSLIQLTALSTVFLVSACGSNTKSNETEKQEDTNSKTQASVALATSNSPSVSPNVQGLTVIREQQKGHAALFAAIPDQAGAVFSGVSVPQNSFVGGAYFSGKLTASTLNQMFTKTLSPMSETERQEILTHFEGAMFVYFEGYTDSVCSNQSIEVDLLSTLGNYKLTSMAKFVAVPQPLDDCKLLSDSEVTLTESSD